MENEFKQPPKNGSLLRLVAPCFLGLISRVTIYLGFALVATFFLHGIGSRLTELNLPEATMQINFGPDWRNMMDGAVETNRVQFQRMEAILDQIHGRDVR